MKKKKKNVNMTYLDDQFGRMNANNLMEIKNDLLSMPLKAIVKEVESNNYPIENYKKLSKEALVDEIVIYLADNDIPVEADELEAILSNDLDFLNTDVNEPTSE